jgi:hypothetical protein
LNSPTEFHLFKNADEYFNIKHDIFVDDYLDDCIMGGEGLNFSNLSEIEFILHDQRDENSLFLILNSMVNTNPMISVMSYSSLADTTFFDIYYINNYADIEDFYCFKQTFDFEIEGIGLYQIYEVKVKSLDMINDFWLTQ